MDVLLNEEEKMLQSSVRVFLESECSTELVRDMETDEKGYPPELWKKMAQLGWQALALPEVYGGQGLPLGYLAIVLEEIGRAIAPVPFHSTMVPALTIARHGSYEQCRDILPLVARGETILTWAFTDTVPKLLPETITFSAIRENDDFILTGSKMFVDNFNVADKCLVVARTGENSHGEDGLSLFLVDTHVSGISYKPLVTMAKDSQSRVEFDNVRVPSVRMIGRYNEGWPIIERLLDDATILLCAQMLGAARKDAEMALEYAKNRTAFGRPIGAFQSIQHLCADSVMWVDGGQLLTFEAIWRMDQGLPAQVEVSQAKAFCNEKCEAVVRSGQIIHGGIGFMMEFDLHLWYRRVSAWTMRLGTSFEHRARIARALLDKPGQVRLGDSLSTR